ncbi:hypothetical protein BD410DRAFT_810535 [Rickenella mellea]|uniref:Ribonuclease H1 N-terminal domain-containing protein n=1 Tax=Rickenella mellea TaxID=50990 RepID=A0A4Y7PDT5_9AGAM|nr:hypothetical protein BD410DRAFT_810535 [Rickenella mellea]
MLELPKGPGFEPQTPKTAAPAWVAEDEPRYVGDDAWPSSQQSQFSQGEDDPTNPFFPPNLSVSEPPRQIKGAKGHPIYVSSSPPQPATADTGSEEDEFILELPTPAGHPTCKGPWYSVTKGRSTGVFEGWALTSTLVSGFSGASYTMHKKEEVAHIEYIKALREAERRLLAGVV